ncbi:class I SAM-dependent methyltransferase [Micromonospora sp. BRA006-A]|nr:class I SAM-dependent methyltransferase [Micromonospora sp. BRA006-A]
MLDVGCGTGELALALARRGHDVTRVDISPVAIDQARAKAAAAGLPARFEVCDATAIPVPRVPYDSVFDSGLLHSLDRRGAAVRDYLALLPRWPRRAARCSSWRCHRTRARAGAWTRARCARPSPSRRGRR